MTRKQLESIIRFSADFNDQANDISVVNEQYGLSLTDKTSPSQAVTAYLEAKGIMLEGEAASDSELLPEFKGTNGKWTTTYDDWDGYGVRLVEEGFSFGIVYIAQNISQGEDDGYADALLISKAPELLQFIIDYYRYLNLDDQKKAKELIKSATEVANG